HVLERLRCRQEPGAPFEQAQAVETPLPAPVVDKVDRVGKSVGNPPGAIAERARSEQRNDDVRPTRNAPLAERLAEILVVAIETGGGGRIEDAADAGDRVQQEAFEVAQAGERLALQELVDDRARIGGVAP